MSNPTVFEVTPEGLVVLDQEVKSLAVEDQNPILKSYLPSVVNALDLIARAEKISVTSVEQKDEMAKAREIRLALQKVRTGANKIREDLKAESLKKGNAIQKVYNLLKDIIEPVETKLDQAEKFAEIAEAKRKEEIKKAREAEFAPYALEELFRYWNFGEMSETAYTAILDGAKKAKAEFDKAEAEKKAEAERKEKEKEEERLKLVEENRKLTEQAKADREAREKAEAETKKAEDEKREAEAQAKAKAESDAKAQADEKFALFLKKNGVTRESVEAGAFKVIRTDTGFSLYKFIDSFTA